MATYNPYNTGSGGDPRGQTQNEIGYQKNRFESQQGPLGNAMAYNYGRGSEADYGNYQNIMNMYGNIASGQGGTAGSVGGGGGYSPFTIGYKDPFNSYEGFTDFSKTGGYSPADIANMRARGVGGVRSAYANAQQEMSRGRSLQGGYSPNMNASLVKMARERGQATADATQGVEAGLASERQKGRLAGLTGMSGIEGQRLGADLDVAKFNAQQQSAAQSANNSSGAAAAGQSAENQMAALRGMTSLYGTTPGQSQLFGNQALQATQMGGNFGMGMVNATGNAGQQTGQYDQTMNRVQQGVNMGAQIAYPFLDQYNKNKQQQQNKPGSGGYGPAGKPPSGTGGQY